jgi:crotonobetainyl-CoA:carnitine CoA-transferase CaiB-like acyl-CoA transferase
VAHGCHRGRPPHHGRGAPVLGRHTREVLRENGYAEAEIDRLAAEGAILLG